jgi:hypothetical protein
MTGFLLAASPMLASANEGRDDRRRTAHRTVARSTVRIPPPAAGRGLGNQQSESSSLERSGRPALVLRSVPQLTCQNPGPGRSPSGRDLRAVTPIWAR